MQKENLTMLPEVRSKGGTVHESLMLVPEVAVACTFSAKGSCVAGIP